MKRISSIDYVRGFVMIIMALDHTRDLIHVNSITQSPTDLTTTTPLVFFTRLITHICAPTFVFLSGTSAYISLKNKANLQASRVFLLTRGIWLVILEFTVVSFGIWFDIHFSVFLFDVIATIGFGFIILSLLLKLNPKLIGIIGLIIIFSHNIFGLITFSNDSTLKTILTPLFNPMAIPFSHSTFVMGYPPLPWLGIMLVGFASGKLFELDEPKRKKTFLQLGLTSLALFIIIRVINIYGDSFPWARQKTNLYSFLSFINITKYPPSLVFCLFTLGFMFIMLFLFEGVHNKFSKIMAVYGKVPLFYFLVHWYIIHPILFLILFLQGYKSSDFIFGFNFGRPKGESGVNIWIVYLIWIFVVVILYPLCKWYGNYKMKHKENKWLSYL
jgi:uncharacterized membrane protein